MSPESLQTTTKALCGKRIQIVVLFAETMAQYLPAAKQIQQTNPNQEERLFAFPSVLVTNKALKQQSSAVDTVENRHRIHVPQIKQQGF